MNGPVILGVLLLGLAALLLLGARRARARHRRLYLTETLDTATLRALHEAATAAAGPDSFRQPVDLEGAAAPGPDGPLTSAVTGTSCVWYRHLVTRRYTVHVKDSAGKVTDQVREETVSDFRSEQPFAVRDAGGEVLVSLTGDVEAAERVQDAYDEQRDGSTLGHRTQEWVLRAGTPVYVHGEAADRDGRLTVGAPSGTGGDRDRMLVSTRSQAEVLERATASARRTLVGAGVSGVAGAALLVVGVL